MPTQHWITIPVHDVEVQGDAFPVISGFDAIREQVLSLPLSPEWSERDFENATRSKTLEACSMYGGELCAGPVGNPLAACISSGYECHRPVSISPDMIWLTICQGVAQHVQNHAEALRDRFVRHSGKRKLEIRRDDLFIGSLDNDWASVVEELSLQLNDCLSEDVQQRFVAKFSTTGPSEILATRAAFMESMQRYFQIPEVNIICGIPSITLEGTSDDWQLLSDRLDGFVGLQLEWWLDLLRPILHQFARASTGDIDRKFWQSMFRFRYGVCGITNTDAKGWLIGLFPYLLDRGGNATRANPWLANPEMVAERQWLFYDEGPLAECERQVLNSRKYEKLCKWLDRQLISVHEWRAQSKTLIDEELTLSTKSKQPIHGFYVDQIPLGVSRIPFILKDATGTRQQETEFVSGFMGISQHPDSLTLRPYIGWAIRKVDCRPPAKGKTIAMVVNWPKPLQKRNRQGLILESSSQNMTLRALDLLAPISKGSSGMIAAPPGAGKTTLLRAISESIVTNYSDCSCHFWSPGEISPVAMSAHDTLPLVELESIRTSWEKIVQQCTRLFDQAKSLVDAGKDVVILIDSFDLLVNAWNAVWGNPQARTGTRPAGWNIARRILSLAGEFENDATLTIVATFSIDTGRRSDDMLLEYVKDLFDMHVRLDRELARRKIWPAIDIHSSGSGRNWTRYLPLESSRLESLLRKLTEMDSAAAMLQLLGWLQSSKSNADLLTNDIFGDQF